MGVKIEREFRVLDASGQALAYIYARGSKAQVDIAKVLTFDEARRIAVNVVLFRTNVGKRPYLRRDDRALSEDRRKRAVGERSRIYRQVTAKFLETGGYRMYFKIGDTVILKSGGPVMTVTAIDNEGLVVWCTWFDGNDEKQESFPADALEAHSD